MHSSAIIVFPAPVGADSNKLSLFIKHYVNA